MSDFKAKMHQNRFWHPAGGAYSASPDPVAAFKGPTSKGRGGNMGRQGEGRGRERRRREGKGPRVCPTHF